ncbi:unnamed protein product [Owenia fusiformis]|uniref:Glycogen debranching enzyme n=1 Tax=Owenia fusiformis TaxID=6347 RepID=A0A8S4N1Z7_OWEFU|nr:unnamed protein product [Owenia fusiformis]
MSAQVRLLTLNKGENKETVLFRLQKGWKLHFVLGPSLQAEDVHVFSNHPQNASSTFLRNQYREIPWQSHSKTKADRSDSFAEIDVVVAGSFNYYFTINGSPDVEYADGCGYFLVDPQLTSGPEKEQVSLDCIQCQTVLTKLLGPFQTWESKLAVAKETGYNMIHFTPLQQLGHSDSAYSLANQHEVDRRYGANNTSIKWDDVQKLVSKMDESWSVLSLTDLVFNHTANNSPWIEEHPECAYNVHNSPHLRPAYVLDRILWHFSMEVAEGVWTENGIPPEINSECHLQAVQNVLLDKVIPKSNLNEFFILDVDSVLEEFKACLDKGLPPGSNGQGEKEMEGKVEVKQDSQWRRLHTTINMDKAMQLYRNEKFDDGTKEATIEKCVKDLEFKLKELNNSIREEVQSHLTQAVNNFIANGRYRFLADDGPKYDKVSKSDPIMDMYFTHPGDYPEHGKSVSVEMDEVLSYEKQGAWMMAHNGWVMNDDPLRNFAEPGSNIYFRRELIAWGDSVKLRYGDKPEDCPYLWQYMLEYTVTTAQIFHGIRLDNCHSTPLHVAEYMLDAARKVRPDMYVIAELFTSSEHTDNVFINRLGINSLIREAMSAWDAHEEGRLVYRYGGEPVGAFIQPSTRPLQPSIAHALFMDQTHDNPSPVEKRSVFDLLPSAGLVSMACCATGSNRGYDELVPHHIHVVNETREYAAWTDSKVLNKGSVNQGSGIIAAKTALNRLHFEMGEAGFTQVYVDQVDKDIVAVTRHNPNNHRTIILVARTAFSYPSNPNKTGFVPPLCVPGIVEEIIVEARTICKGASEFKKEVSYVNGVSNYGVTIQEHVKLYESDMVELKDPGDGHLQEIDFVNFPPGSVIAFRICMSPESKTAILAIRSALTQFGFRMRSYSGSNLQQTQRDTDFKSIISRMSLSDLNRVMYRCDAEEKDDGKGFAVYDIPKYGPLVYCGIQGVMSLLTKIHANNDLGHPLCENIRNGDWLLQYTANRMKANHGTKQLGLWFEGVFEFLAKIPRYLVPCYFDAIMTGASVLIHDAIWNLMGEFVKDGSSFVRALALGSTQMCGIVKTAPLPTLSPSLNEPKPPTSIDEKTGRRVQSCNTLSAGLPHFASGIFRNWGRDTFIAIRGMLLLTGRFQEARYLILAYGGCLRHGLIPNLLGEGTHARYNCRDAIWWWLQCIQDYCNLAPNGTDILLDTVSRLYPQDGSEAQSPGTAEMPLQDVIQEALSKHIEGIKYRERNAGPNIDREMTDEGFNIEVGVDDTTGFVYGGNIHNCGTWMDKMGSSDKAGNKGKPATPRDGSAIELIGLCYSALQWLIQLHSTGKYPNDRISTSTTEITFNKWSENIKENFEKKFWIDTEPVAEKEPRPDLINRRGIYKDSFGASQFWADFQLRCNFPIAMVVAPQLFTAENAWIALTTAETELLGPLGMKTLDPTDWAYDGNYDNGDDSSNKGRARGFNYHQGPEWVWPVGFFLRAKLHFAKILEQSQPGILDSTIKFVRSTLTMHHIAIQSSDWRSLPELTNKDGAVCRDSCPAQAWSMGCILEVLYDLEQL